MAIDKAALKFAFSAGALRCGMTNHPDKEESVEEIDKRFEIWYAEYQKIEQALTARVPW